MFDLRGQNGNVSAIEQLGDIFCEISDLFSRCKTDFAFFSVISCVISAPEDNASDTSLPHRINSIYPKEVDAVLNQYVAAGRNPALDFALCESTGGRISLAAFGSPGATRSLTKTNSLSQLPRVDWVFDSFGKGSVCSLFDVIYSSHENTPPHEDTVNLTACHTLTGLYESRAMPQGSSPSPGEFVKMINQRTKIYKVAAYLDDVIAFDAQYCCLHIHDTRTIRAPTHA